VHLETALRGVIIGERWPKAGCEVVVTVLEGEEDGFWADPAESGRSGGWGMMNVLAGCITVASAALADAGIDCVDLISGGVAALVETEAGPKQYLVDPSPSEQVITAACVVGYLQSRDQLTEIWLKGDIETKSEVLLDSAVRAAVLTRTVLVDAVKEATELKLSKLAEDGSNSASDEGKAKVKGKDVIMSG
jgi:exosome complex component MTR3